MASAGALAFQLTARRARSDIWRIISAVTTILTSISTGGLFAAVLLRWVLKRRGKWTDDESSQRGHRCDVGTDKMSSRCASFHESIQGNNSRVCVVRSTFSWCVFWERKWGSSGTKLLHDETVQHHLCDRGH